MFSYTITDLIGFHKRGEINLNPDFQRGAVWFQAAQSSLIDTLLRGYPIPKIYIRTKTDVETQKTIREVVDGQQRLRAIYKFVSNKLTLGPETKEYNGLKYEDLSDVNKERFLEYAIGVESLSNAKDEYVLEVFSRLNSYTVALKPAELRNALFQGSFKWAVREQADKWARLMKEMLSLRQMVRMEHHSIMAEMFGFVLEGVTDGGASKMNALYRRHDQKFGGEEREKADQIIDKVLIYVDQHLVDFLHGSRLMQSTHFLILFAALAHSAFGIPKGELDSIPASPQKLPENIGELGQGLVKIANAIENDPVSEGPLRDFWKASAGSTQRIKTRKIRFNTIYQVLQECK